MKMKYRITIFGVSLVYLIYFIALVYQNNTVGDILSPIITFIAFVPAWIGYVWKEKHKLLRLSGLFYALCILTWVICDAMWGISSLLLHVDPENNLFINNS